MGLGPLRPMAGLRFCRKPAGPKEALSACNNSPRSGLPAEVSKMPTYASLRAIEFHLPEACLTNDDLAAEYPEWSADKIGSKTGIHERRIAGADETASDLAFEAGKRLLDANPGLREEIDYVLFCTQSPDYFLPTTACVLQDRLGLPTTAGALDFNLGCSGYIYGLGLAQGLIETGQATKVLFLTGDTYSKFIHPRDKSVRTLFGDAGSASLIAGEERDVRGLGPFLYGTDGRGANNLIVKTGGVREPRTQESGTAVADDSGNVRSRDNLYMNGAEIFNFTLQTVPPALRGLLEKANLTLEDVDLFVFHQANEYMLEHLRKKVGIPKEKFYIAMRDCGNTVSATIPIALKRAMEEGRAKPGMTVALVGFGVGYSWGGTLVRLS